MANQRAVSMDQDVMGGSARKKQLVRSNAMCGDDDTRLHPLDSSALDPSISAPGRTKHYSTTSTMSRDSTDYTDSTGIDLLQFIVSTLHKNAKDREMLLSLESEMRKFVLDKSKQAYKFPKMSSYNRMLVHRVAAFFGLNHNIDQSGTLVVVNKTPSTRIPDIEFQSCIRNNIFTDKIRRNVQSFDEDRLSGNGLYGAFPSPHQAAGMLPGSQPFAYANFRAQPSVLSQMEMMRRARSFEVGEWSNTMAAGQQQPPSGVGIFAHRMQPMDKGDISGGSWQQLPNQTNMGGVTNQGAAAVIQPAQFVQQYSTSRPPSLVSSSGGQVGGSHECIMVDPSSSPYKTRQLSSSSSIAAAALIPPPSYQNGSGGDEESSIDPSYVLQGYPQQWIDPSMNYIAPMSPQYPGGQIFYAPNSQGTYVPMISTLNPMAPPFAYYGQSQQSEEQQQQLIDQFNAIKLSQPPDNPIAQQPQQMSPTVIPAYFYPPPPTVPVSAFQLQHGDQMKGYNPYEQQQFIVAGSDEGKAESSENGSATSYGRNGVNTGHGPTGEGERGERE